MQKIKLFLSYLSRIIQYFTKNFKGILLALFIVYLILPSADDIKPANVSRIDLTGMIINSQKIIEKIDEVIKDPQIKGVLLVVNSPGGSVPPSIEISYAIKRLALVKPVVTYAQGTLASGSYYASIWSHKIIANPGSIIGSIGVIFQGYNLEKVMDKLGVSSQVVKAGKYKETGTFNREWTDGEHQELQTVIKDIYTLFVHDVCVARNLDISKEKVFADAHIFSAQQAKNIGLIDAVATIHDAKLALKELTKLQVLIWQKPTLSETFLEQLSSKMMTGIDTYFLQPTLK